jgi:hypothetical protein
MLSAAPTRVTPSRGYQRLAVAAFNFHQFFDESQAASGFVSLMISGIYRLFELSLSQIKHAI